MRKMILWIYFVGVLTLLAASAYAQEYSRPASGTYIKDNWRSGSGVLNINNGQNLDAVAALRYPNGQVYLATYIRSGESATLTGLQDGTYEVFFTIGKNWDSEACKFAASQGYFKLNTDARFNTDWKDTGHYTIATLQLKANPGMEGAVSSRLLTESEFPNLKSGI